jgi:transcriptional regulator with XRE-family HTH domain
MPRESFRTLGDYLRKLRETRGLTQEAVEKRSGQALTREYLSLLESGKRKVPSPQMCKALARVYGVPWKDVWLAAQAEMMNEPVTAEIRQPEGAEKVTSAYEGMNEKGRERLLEYARLLARDPKYTK